MEGIVDLQRSRPLDRRQHGGGLVQHEAVGVVLHGRMMVHDRVNLVAPSR